MDIGINMILSPNNIKSVTETELLELESVNEGPESIIEYPEDSHLPIDLDLSLSSLNSELSCLESGNTFQVSQIKDINKEIKWTAKMAIKKFKNTSKSLLSISRGDTGSGATFSNELDQLRKNLSNVTELFEGRKKEESVNSRNNILVDPGNLETILGRIKSIQNDIREASEKLQDSEKLIVAAEENNVMLENKIKIIENNMNHVLVAEGPEKSSKEHCLCILF